MSNDLSDISSTKKPFFRKLDWSSFWTATIASFIVYFLTLGPSVGLEDSGELAVAGDHLGVPHPPGYPIWTIISYAFARVFSFVTFRGQPNPAWAIALSSAVFGALAAGCTAMLITRSASDMLSDMKSVIKRAENKGEELLCWVGGVAGSLIFAFSPVMWSQSTIVEVYSLGAFFLMLVLLLTYRWMRKPQDKVLWLAAFVFGLGLTNYQVLLLAALPLVVIIFLRNIALFRDFILVAIPIGLASIILKLGSLDQHKDLVKCKLYGLEYKYNYTPDGQAYSYYADHLPVSLPSRPLCIAAAVVFCIAVVGALVYFICKRKFSSELNETNNSNPDKSSKLDRSSEFAKIAIIASFALSALLLLLASFITSKAVINADNPSAAALYSPIWYCRLVFLLILGCGASLITTLFGEDRKSDIYKVSLMVSGVTFAVAMIMALALPTPELAAQFPENADLSTIPTLGVGFYNIVFIIGLLVVAVIASFIPRGFLFALPILAVEAIAFVLIHKGVMLGLTHPTTWWFIIPVIFNFFILVMAALALPSGKSVAMTVLMSELGVSFYIYMPIVSDLRNPPMNWGYPRTWEGFKHAITRGQYEKITPTNIFAPRFIEQLGDYFTDLRRQFTLILAPFGFLPFCAWKFSSRKREEDSSEFGVRSSEMQERSKIFMHAEKVRKNNSELRASNSELDDGKRPISKALPLLMGFAAIVLWSLDFFVSADAISDALGSVMRLAAVLLMTFAIALSLYNGIRPIKIAVVMIAMTVIFVMLGNIASIERGFDAARVDKLSFGLLLLLCLFGGILMTFAQVWDAVKRMISERRMSEMITVSLVVGGFVLFILAFTYKVIQAIVVYLLAGKEGFSKEQMSTDWLNIFEVVSKNNNIFVLKIVPVLIAILLVGGLLFGLWLLTRKPRVKPTVDDVSQQWLIGSVCNFIVMSIMLIMLANPKGDLQDTFIQKVKFISSHGLFALWIGYGLIFALIVWKTMLSKLKPQLRKSLVALAAVVVLLSALIPIQQNYFNDRLVFELSGAEQNGHDYGWQFGNYQLRGADAIIEELTDDEEPLPNPSYPPAMGEGAVFFGGTDPGRFVPTYMIYSAKVRPDVFLITQNALADNTFMSVTRDLYGDQIWIPTPKDSEDAFQIYIDEVKSGKRPPSSDIVVQGGRVQVVGALGVMEINGILCKMIFDHNKPGAYELRSSSEFGVRSSEIQERNKIYEHSEGVKKKNSELRTPNSELGEAGHEFYVEESYVIPWMYPYLTPHGLIMHINREPTALTTKNVNDDMDFWDWYVRRITRDDKYRRDVVAQKSFSKLRSAIAGLYMNKGRHSDAERAYNNARILYPVSPEATFRMIQDILFRQERWNEALLIADYFCKQDPNNDRGPYVRDVILDQIKLKEEHAALLSEYNQRRNELGGGYDPSLALVSYRLAEYELKLNKYQEAFTHLNEIPADAPLKEDEIYMIASLMLNAGDVGGALRFVDRLFMTPYLLSSSERVNFAALLYTELGDYSKVKRLMQTYISQNKNDWESYLRFASYEHRLGKRTEAFSKLEVAISRKQQNLIMALVDKDELIAALVNDYIKVTEQIRQQQQQQQGTPFGGGASRPGVGGVTR